MSNFQWIGSGNGMAFNTLSPTPTYILDAKNYTWAGSALTVYGKGMKKNTQIFSTAKSITFTDQSASALTTVP